MVKKLSLGKKKSLKPKKLKISKPKLSAKSLKSAILSVKAWSAVLLVAGLGVFGYGVYYWYTQIYTDSENIFYGMLDNSLETSSISRQVAQTEGNRSETQNFLLTFSPTPLVESESTVEQIDQTRQKSTVNTETIGTKDADYVRYTNISVPSTPEQGDYSDALNVWAQRPAGGPSGQNAQFLNEAIFTFIPFGNFNGTNRAEIINLIKEKEVYKIGNDAKITYDNGRPVFSATVSIKPRGLIETLRLYNEKTGIGDASLLNPDEYDDNYNFGISLKIDVLSRHLTEIKYPGSSRIETYASYGLTRNIEVPETAITVEELQSKLQ